MSPEFQAELNRIIEAMVSAFNNDRRNRGASVKWAEEIGCFLIDHADGKKSEIACRFVPSRNEDLFERTGREVMEPTSLKISEKTDNPAILLLFARCMSLVRSEYRAFPCDDDFFVNGVPYGEIANARGLTAHWQRMPERAQLVADQLLAYDITTGEQNHNHLSKCERCDVRDGESLGLLIEFTVTDSNGDHAASWRLRFDPWENTLAADFSTVKQGGEGSFDSDSFTPGEYARLCANMKAHAPALAEIFQSAHITLLSSEISGRLIPSYDAEAGKLRGDGILAARLGRHAYEDEVAATLEDACFRMVRHAEARVFMERVSQGLGEFPTTVRDGDAVFAPISHADGRAGVELHYRGTRSRLEDRGADMIKAYTAWSALMRDLGMRACSPGETGAEVRVSPAIALEKEIRDGERVDMRGVMWACDPDTGAVTRGTVHCIEGTADKGLVAHYIADGKYLSIPLAELSPVKRAQLANAAREVLSLREATERSLTF